MRNGARKRQVRPVTVGNRSPLLVPDEIHTGQVPCCQLVKEVTYDVLPEAIETVRVPVSEGKARPTSSAASEPSLFGILLRNHLVELRKSQCGDAVFSKKKKKRKKKKKTSDFPITDDSGEGTTSMALQMKTSPLDWALREVDPASPSNFTTFIEGKITSPKSKNSENVMAWIDKIIAESPTVTEIPNRNLITFVESIAKMSPAISIDEIAENVHRVACERCQTQADSYWRSTRVLGNGENMDNQRVSLHPNMIAPSRLTLPIAGIEDDCYEQAFDYVPLEEGYGPAEGDDGGSWVMQTTIDHVTTRPLELVMQQPLDLSGVERLTRDLILPCGLPEIEDPDAYMLTDQEFHSVIARQRKHEEHIISTLEKMKAQRSEIQLELNETSSPRKQEVDIKLGQAFRDINERCEFLLSEWLKLLLQVTEYYEGINDAGWACSKIERFWKVYSKGLNHIIRASLTHQARLIQLAHPPGVLPQMLLNAQCRRSYRSLLEEKFQAIAAIHDGIFPSIGHEEGEPSFMKNLLTYQSFCFVTSNERPMNMSALDGTFTMLLTAFKECAATVQKCGHVDDLFATQQERTSLLSDLLRKVNKELEEEYVVIEEHLQKKEKLQWQELRKQYEEFSIEPTHAPNFDGDENDHGARDLKELQIRLGSMASIAVSQWRCMREMQRMTRYFPRTEMPLRLKKWMLASEHSAHLTHSGELVCTGNGGKRRLACIIASLYYKWLVARCNEWHADLMHKELLLDAGAPNSVDTSESKVKSINKRKKKKGSNTATLSLGSLEGDIWDETLINQGQNGTDGRKARKEIPVPSKGRNADKGAAIGSITKVPIADPEVIFSDDAWTPIRLKETKVRLKSLAMSESAVVPLALPVKTKAGDMEDTKPLPVGDNDSDAADGIVAPVNIATNVSETALMSNEVQVKTSVMVKGLGNAETLLEVSCERYGDNYASEANEEEQDDEFQIHCVGVTSRNGFKLAEEYLVSRFDALLENNKQSKDKINVVFL